MSLHAWCSSKLSALICNAVEVIESVSFVHGGSLQSALRSTCSAWHDLQLTCIGVILQVCLKQHKWLVLYPEQIVLQCSRPDQLALHYLREAAVAGVPKLTTDAQRHRMLAALANKSGRAAMIAGSRVACQYFFNMGMMARPDEVRAKRVSDLMTACAWPCTCEAPNP